jgi:hypothetical protein
MLQTPRLLVYIFKRFKRRMLSASLYEGPRGGDLLMSRTRVDYGRSEQVQNDNLLPLPIILSPAQIPGTAVAVRASVSDPVDPVRLYLMMCWLREFSVTCGFKSDQQRHQGSRELVSVLRD